MIQLFASTFTYTSKIDNKDYVFTPLTIGDLADYCLWLKFKELEEFNKVAKELISPDLRSKLEREIYDRCYLVELKFNDPKVLESFGTLPGMFRQIYLSLRKEHKDIKSADIPNIVVPEDMRIVIDKISFLSGIVEEGGKKEEEEDEILGES